jgi:hypothetical protein
MRFQDQPPPVRRQSPPREAARYILVVDHQPKRGFDHREAAEAEASRILDRFPNLKVCVEENEEAAARF